MLPTRQPATRRGNVPARLRAAASALWLAPLLLLAPHASQAAAPPAAPRALVRAIRVEGVHRVEESAVRIHVGHPVGVALDEAAVDADVKAVYRMGFFDNVWVTTEASAGGLVLTYHVAERPYVTKVEFHGNDAVKKADLEAVVGIRPRTVFDPQRAWDGIREARKTYAGEGYPTARALRRSSTTSTRRTGCSSTRSASRACTPSRSSSCAGSCRRARSGSCRGSPGPAS
jgi:outer membrane protein assembly factor BamA